MTCKRGHEFRGDENYRARHGWCPVCFREIQARYRASAKSKKAHDRYNHSPKGQARYHKYQGSPKGWMNRLESRRAHALQRRADRANKQEAEDSNG